MVIRIVLVLIISNRKESQRNISCTFFQGGSMGSRGHKKNCERGCSEREHCHSFDFLTRLGRTRGARRDDTFGILLLKRCNSSVSSAYSKICIVSNRNAKQPRAGRSWRPPKAPGLRLRNWPRQEADPEFTRFLGCLLYKSYCMSYARMHACTLEQC